MSKLNTKAVKATGSTVPKEVQPGNSTCKINNVGLDDFKFKEGAKHVVLYLETTPMSNDFVGFVIDKENPDAGSYKGQVGRVKATEWAFADGETKSGKEVSRDVEIIRFLKTLCQALGKDKWMDAQDDKHDSIESLVAKFNEDKPYADVFLNYCIGGKEYKNRQGYLTYDLFLPKFSRKGVPFEAVNSKLPKLLKFDQEEHIKKSKNVEVESFATSDDTPVSEATSNGFEV